MLRRLTLGVVALLLLMACSAQAEVVLEWVIIGDAGNAADTHGWQQGAVEYNYRIGKYEVTNGQYIEFLNAVARVEDTYSLYNDTHFGGGMPGTYGGIERTGSPGNYSYGPKGGDTSWLNKPVNFVSYYDALRLANWLHNGQPSGAQDPTSTEDGAYTFSGPTTVDPRNLDARVFLPSGDEWYKAAYYKGGGTDAGYWDYATQSDDAPIAEPPPGHPAPPGSANYANVVGPPYYSTDIGAYVLSPSPYGTFDQNGNMSEWAEDSYLPGGSWNADVPPASVLNWGWPDLEAYGVGFRVAKPWFCGSEEDCDDGEFCNGLETCDPITGCQPGALVDCSELTDQCNEGVCDEPSDSCVAVPAEDGTACDDGDACAGDTCQAGTCAPVNCVLYVDDDAPLGGDGTNWSSSFRHLQDALGAATPGDEIHVASGIYKPDQDEAGNVTPGKRYETFQLIDAVGIYGGYRGCPAGDCGSGNPDERDIELYESILSADLLGNDNPPVAGPGGSCCTDHDSPGCDDPACEAEVCVADPVCCTGVWDSLCAASALGLCCELCNGNVNTCENSYHVVTARNTDETAVLNGVTITGGNADGPWPHNDGGGISCKEWSSPVIVNCMFNRNSASRWGAGMYISDSSPSLSGSTFTDNSAGAHGGGMFNLEGDPALEDCTFSRNSAEGSGGGIWSQGSPALDKCVFSGNSAHDGAGMFNGLDSNPVLNNCIFDGNSAEDDGGGVYNLRSSPIFANCTFIGNSATDDGGGMLNFLTSYPTLTDSILWNNSASDGPQIHSVASTPTVTYSCVEDGNPDDGSVYPGAGNIDEDPLFVDSGYWDDGGTPGDPSDDVWVDGSYRVLPGSPCINAGDGDYLAEPGETDLDGRPRVLCGRVDMGAYEFGIGDFDCDQSVNLADFAAWPICMTGPHGGPYDTGCEAFDFNADDHIDLSDFAGYQRAFAGLGP